MSDKMLRSALICAAAMLFSQHAQAQFLDDYPDAPAKNIILERCGLCHSLRNARSSDFDRQGWHELLSQMRNMGAALSDSELELLTDYLTVNSPPKFRPPAVIIPGEVDIRVTEWDVPTSGSMPRDIAIAEDEKFWISATFAGNILEVDPQTGSVTEHRIRPYSAPMGIAIDANGDVWFASNRRSYVGRFTPSTGGIDYIEMPGGMPPDPSDLVIDESGLSWFTAQDGNVVGRLNPQTREMQFVEMPREEATPFAMVIAPDGNIFVGLRDSKSILRIDAENLTTREFPLTDPQAEPRRLAVTEDGIVWYSDVDRGYLGRLDPITGRVTEYPSPSGPASDPHGIAAIGNIVWYVETSSSPNNLVRFDPATESFQTWPLSGYAVIRDLAVTKDGNLAFAMGSLNRVGLIEIRD